MKTFTNYAEKKAKQFLNLLQSYTKGIRITAILILLLMGVNSAWAVDHTGGYIYFLKPSTWTESKVMMFIGHNSYTSVYEMTKVSNTDNLYCYTMPSWGGATYVAFANDSYVWGTGNWGPSNRTNAKYYTNVYNNYGFNSGSYYVVVPASTSNNANITINYKSSAANLNLTTRANVYGSTDGGSTYASKAAAGTVSVSGYYMSNYSTASTRSAVSSTSSQAYASTTLAPGSTATFKATASTGYEFVGWFDAASGGTAVSTSTTYTYKYDISYTGKTVYGRFKAKTYTVTLNQENATTTGTTSVTATYGVTMPTIATLPTRNGYDFAGYFDAKSGGTKYYNADGSSAKNWDKTSNTTLYAQWTAKEITINWNANGGSVTPTTSTYTYDGNAITLPTPSYAGHRFLGWFTAANGGTQITDVGTTNKPYTTVTYYAHWEVSIVEHKVTFGVGTEYTSYGTLTAATSSGSISSGSNIVEGTSVTFTATPKTGYEVKGWYTNAACTEGEHDAGNTTYTTTITAATNVYVKFVEKTWSVTFAAGTGGSVTTPSSTSQTVGQITGISIAATPATGYTFKQWTITSGSGSFTSAATTNSNKFKPTANSTVTASFTENLYAITVKSSDNNHGTVTQSTDKAGIATTIAITATPVLGYRFVNWTATSGITIADANSTTTTITASAAGTVTANFELIPPTTIYIKSDGNYADFKWNYNSVAYDMTPMDCAGTYYTADVLGGIDEITLTGSNDFTTTTLTVPQDDKTLYDLTSTNITHLYLKPHANWTQASARFAVYFFGSNGNAWQSMTAVGESGYYEAAIPAGSWTGVIFCRMNPSSSTNGWTQDTQLWNQTADLQFPTDGNNLYTLTGGTWSNVTGSWSAHYDNSRWTTFEAPTLGVTINITGKGSIVIDGETYSSNTTGKETFAFTKSSGETIAVGAITPADRWALTSSQITMCNETNDLATSHTISGPATINLIFEQGTCKVIFNLSLPRGVPIPNWTVNNQYIATGDTIVKPTVGEINGYLFAGWYTDGEYSASTLYNFGTKVTKDIELYARWVRYEECIFFKNNLNWDKIYVYTFTSDVWSEKGVTPKNNRNNFGQMTRIGLSDVYYYILTDLNGFSHIAFSDYDMSNYNEFYEHNAIYRADRQDKMQLFIPQRDQTAEKTNNTSYFSSGIWMKYNSNESGYKWSSDKNSWSTDVNPFTAPITGGYTFTTKVYLSGGTTYQFKINNINNDWYSEPKTMTQDDCTDWWFKPESDPNKNAIIQPNVTGEYLFTLYLGDGKVMVSLEYPLGVGDYRLAYKDNTADSFHPGHYIRKRSTGTYRDTTSFFVFHDKAPVILLQECTAIDPATGTATWNTIKMYSCTGDNTTGDNPNNAMLPGKKNADGELSISGSSCGVDKTTVYNFVLLQEDNDANLATSETHLYTGEFYIRTDAAEGGWDYYRQTANKMNFSTYARDHEHFTHYFCRWINANKNVKFTIANDYSLCISDTLDGDELIRKNNIAEGTLPVDANVRFTWDNRDNTITRAYIAGSAWTRDRFLVLAGNEHLKDTDGNPFLEGKSESDRDGLHANEVMFKDLGNWIYQTDVNVNAQTLIRLIATYNSKVQYFKGSESTPINLLSTTATKDYKVRLIYDFKTNHLVVAWLAGGNTVEGADQELGTDMMIIRHNQNGAEQLHFNPNANTLSGVGTGYAVITFDKYFLNNLNSQDGKELPENEKKSQYERALYWISFPFDVKLKEVFGFGEYGQHWIMEYYDGAARAANGLWADSDTYWKYITNHDYTLKAGQGYVLCLNLNKMVSSSTVFTNTNEVSLYFPSASPLQTITGEVTTAKVPAHTCTIERDNRNIYDSNWNLIGVPGFKDITGVGVGGSAHDTIVDANVTENCVNFYYKYIPKDNKYEATDNTNTNDFQTMFSYMVQFAGIVEWSTPEFVKGISARRVGNMPSEHTLRLEFLQSETLADQTIVKLQEQDATADFDMNIDMAKMMNSGTNIYTMTANTNIMVGGNALPIARTTVPVGVRVDATGEYTFRMPDGTDGISVILLDNQTGAHTNMLYDEYTVTLDAGTYENRFSLSVDPNRSATSVENIFGDDNEENGDKATGVKKFIIDGQLFIRTANGLFDAKGQRL